MVTLCSDGGRAGRGARSTLCIRFVFRSRGEAKSASLVGFDIVGTARSDIGEGVGRKTLGTWCVVYVPFVNTVYAHRMFLPVWVSSE